MLFDPIEVGGQTPVVTPSAGLLHQTRFFQIVQRPLHRRAGKAAPSGDGFDARPVGALLVINSAII